MWLLEEEVERYFYLSGICHHSQHTRNITDTDSESERLTLSIMSCTSQGITDTSADWRRTMKTKHRERRKRKVEGRWYPSTFLIMVVVVL